MELPLQVAEMVVAIARVKDALPFRYRRYLNCYGVYVQGRPLPNGEEAFFAGSRDSAFLHFIRGADGVIRIVRYQPGAWETALARTYAKAQRVQKALAGGDGEALQSALERL
ncbi:hypothetical protein HRbin23_00378 [bacterium HR23]|nr:hypothetical protein HRbin23_00378 [bacterium HR23]